MTGPRLSVHRECQWMVTGRDDGSRCAGRNSGGLATFDNMGPPSQCSRVVGCRVSLPGLGSSIRAWAGPTRTETGTAPPNPRDRRPPSAIRGAARGRPGRAPRLCSHTPGTSPSDRIDPFARSPQAIALATDQPRRPIMAARLRLSERSSQAKAGETAVRWWMEPFVAVAAGSRCRPNEGPALSSVLAPAHAVGTVFGARSP